MFLVRAPYQAERELGMNPNPYVKAYEQALAELHRITEMFEEIRHRRDQVLKLRDTLRPFVQERSESSSPAQNSESTSTPHVEFQTATWN